MNIKDFFGLCASHDWTYNYSDDNSKYREGYSQAQELRNHMKDNPVLHGIYVDWFDFMFYDRKLPKLEDYID